MNEKKGVLTIRLIRSFQYRNIKHIVLKDVNLSLSVVEFMDVVNAGTFCNY